MAQEWQAHGLAVETASNWHAGRQLGRRMVCQVACAAALDGATQEDAATETWQEGWQAAAMIAAAPEMLSILRQMTAAADLGEVDLEPEDAALLEAARAVVQRIEEAGRFA
jgi:hypothetical protein